LSHAVGEAYGTLLAKGRHPAVYLFLEIDPALVDINVHPAKREVRFRDTQSVYQAVKNVIRERLRREGLLIEPSVAYVLTNLAAGSAGRDVPPGGGSPTAAWRSSDAAPAAMAREAMAVYRPPEGGEAPLRPDPADRFAGILPTDRIRPLGQIDQTYIIAAVGSSSESELHLIDQHAAHERLLFERLLSQQRTGQIAVQSLLIPEIVEFPAAEAVRIGEILPLFATIGMEVEAFGDRSFRIRSVPALLGAVDGRMLIQDILDDVDSGAAPAAEETIRTVIASMACHAAIKAHQSLQPEQMTRLLEDLYRQEVPPTCPHGRPIRVRFSVADLEKLFQRR
jgi:DNA mismatch repair protein MutL